MSDCNSSSYLQNVSVVGRSSMQWGRGHFSEQYCSEYDELLKSLFESKQSMRKTNYEIFNEIKIQSNFVFYHTQSITKITLQPRGGKTELQRVDKDLNGQGQGRPRDMRSGHKGSFHWFRLKACRDKQSVTKHAMAEILGPGRPCIAHLCLAILPDSASAKSGQRGWKTVPWGTIPGAASENHSTLWMLNVCACYGEGALTDSDFWPAEDECRWPRAQGRCYLRLWTSCICPPPCIVPPSSSSGRRRAAVRAYAAKLAQRDVCSN